MNHTKGPWVVGPVDDTVVTHMGKDGIRYEVAAIDGDYNDPDTWPIMEANARLISAAPDLLEVLQECVSWLEPYPMHGGVREKAIAVIAKATGAS